MSVSEQLSLVDARVIRDAMRAGIARRDADGQPTSAYYRDHLARVDRRVAAFEEPSSS